MALNFYGSGFAHKGNSDVQSIFAQNNSCFCVIEVEIDFSIQAAIDNLVRDCDEKQFEHLADFEQYVIDQLHKANVPISTSLVCVLQNGSKIFIKTVGTGAAYLKRGGRVARLVHGNSSASGFVKVGDCVVATTQTLISKIGSEEKFTRSFFQDDIQKNTHSLTEITRKSHESYVAFYTKWIPEVAVPQSVQIAKPEVAMAAHNDEVETDQKQEVTLLNTVKEFWNNKRGTMTKRKTITLGLVGLIFVIFIWSVGLGYIRHQRREIDQKITTAEETITQKLLQAEEVSFLNSARAQALLIDARADLKKLKDEIKDNKNSKVIALEKKIQEMEGRVLKKEEKAFTEYFDLTLDQKNAKGDLMAYSEGNVAILNKAGGVVYVLSLEKKSLDKKSAAQISSADDVALYQDDAYVIKRTDGVYKLLDGGKSTRVIEKDKAWSEITDTELFNGNIYVLDGPNNEIYKYVIADENKFASAGAYFKASQAPAVANPVSIAIDGSVFIVSGTAAAKYTSGLRDGFAPQFPSEDLALKKVLTQEDEGKIYIWDKEHGTIYVVNKEGGYERQIQSSILKVGSDVVVHDRRAYVLQGSKIYTIDLN